MNPSKKKKDSGDLLAKPLFWVVVFVAAIAVLVPTVLVLWDVVSEWGSGKESTAPTLNLSGDVDVYHENPIALEYGLVIQEVGKYSGMYFEDGSNEPVKDVMMLVVENTAPKDLQLARIEVEYSDFTANFQVTNLPAGESVLVLEQNRHASVEETVKTATAKDMAFYQESMSLHEDQFACAYGPGYIEIKNKTQTPITGDIYIYYKNSTSEMFYGGITYRAKIEGGLAGEQTKRVETKHFNPETCQVLMISYAG